MKQTHLIGLAAFGMLALAGCTTTSPNYGSSGYGSSAPYPSQARCADCGLVTRIDVVASNRSAPSATGAILGGIAGAIIGHNNGRRGWEGAAYGLGAGWLLGRWADAHARRSEVEIAPVVAPAASSTPAPAQVTIINNYFQAPATPMSGANSLFGR